MIRAGRLKHRVTLQRPVAARDAYGQDVITWTSAGTVWAAVEPLRGREYFDAQEHAAETTVRIVIRWRSDLAALNLDSTWRVTHSGITYEVREAIHKDLGREGWELMCRRLQ